MTMSLERVEPADSARSGAATLFSRLVSATPLARTPAVVVVAK